LNHASILVALVPVCEGTHPHMASSEGISVDTVANVDVNIVEWYKGKIIVRDLRLVASRLYKASVTRPWTHHVQPCCYIIPLLRCGPLGLYKSIQE